jgi:hypothetical protein
MNLRRFLFQMAALSIIAFLCGAQTLSARGTDRIRGIDGKSILLVQRPDPGFELVTSGGSVAGAFAFFGPGHWTGGRSAIQDAGRRIVTDNHIEDPSVALGAALLADVAVAYGLQVAGENARIVQDDKQLEAFRKSKQVDLILEVYTEAWRTYYFLDFKHYDVWYYAKVRLIYGRTGSVIRSAKCARKPDKTPSSPNIDELLADNGLKLRAAVEKAKQLCLAAVRDDFGI